MPELIYRSRIPSPAEEVFAWHSRPGAFERLQPPWESVRVLERTGSIQDGDRVVVQTRVGPFWIRWVAEHSDYIEGRQFRDIQLRGPFEKWVHTHRFEPDGSDACILEDRIEYLLPFGSLGNLLGKHFTIRKLDRMFAYRHQATIQDLAAQRSYKGGRTMKILVTGSTGLIGSALVPFLTTAGHQVVRMVRSKPTNGDQIQWDPYSGSLDKSRLEGFDAIVHLSGENIAGRWTAAKKTKLRDSRIKSTRLLSKTLAELQKPPKVLVCASAMGYYGNRSDEMMKEDSPPGRGFLAETVKEWEAQVQPAIKKGIRVVNLRTGVVLSPAGGALKEMLLPFKMGVGGVIGSGEQYFSWIAIDDVVGAIYHCINTESLSGPVNVASPNPVTNREFTKTLGRVLSRPTIFPLPAFAARLVFGEMGEELLLASIRVQPAKLQATGYPFRYPDLEGALRHVLGKM
jgi:uncharacterized protein (TIGR01777 family)